MKIRIIVNPKAGAGAGEQRTAGIERALGRAGTAFDLVRTQGPGHATVLAAEARKDGVEVIGVVGGDGTLNEVVQAYLGADGNPVAGPALALFPAGTGGDFRRNYGVTKNPDEAVQRMLTRDPRPLDLAVLELPSAREGQPPARRAFVNVMSFGMSGVIDRLVNEGPKWLGGKAAFALGTLRAMATYRNVSVTIRVDGKDWFEGRSLVTAVANGKYFGGGMKIAPDADPEDGFLDVVMIGDYTNKNAGVVWPRLYKGTHVELPLVKTVRAKMVEAVPTGPPVYIDADGETPGTLPLKTWVCPGALRIRA